MRKRTLVVGLAVAPFAWLAGACGKQERSSPGSALRIVSLAPSITETLFAIGAGSNVIGVSDYCDSPEAAHALPRLGTGLHPNYEPIARLAPNLIVTEANASSRRRELEAIGKTCLLPWLSLLEICQSIRELGSLTGTDEAAGALSRRLLARLNVPEPAQGPRVLLVLGGESQTAGEIWFIRRNSLHGAALHAAGARNAVPEDVNGPPRLSNERLLALDPDAILVLLAPKAPGRPLAKDSLGSLSRFVTLRAVRERKLEALEAAEAFSNGPRILLLVDKIRASLLRLGVG